MNIDFINYLKNSLPLLAMVLLFSTGVSQIQNEPRSLLEERYLTDTTPPIQNSGLDGFNSLGAEDECSQEFPTPEIFFDGIGQLNHTEIANDLVINANEVFTLNEVEVNVLVEPGNPIDGVELYFYSDGGAGPGIELGSTVLIPTSVENLGSVSGLDHLRLTLILADPFTFMGASVQSVVWIGVKLDYPGMTSYMEVSENLNSPNQAYFYDINLGSWLPISVIQGFGVVADGVISFMGDCDELEACDGTPLAGEINSSETFGVCQGDSFSLSVIGQSQEADLLYKWQQKSPDDNQWADIAGSDSPILTLGQGIDEDTDFRFYVECENSGEFAVTDSVRVIIQCYCIPISSCSIGYNITLVSLEGETETLHNPSGCSPNGYGNYTGLTPPDLFPGAGYDLIVGENSMAPIFGNAKVWIDYNQDGEFDENEEVANTNGTGLYDTNTFHISIPDTIDPGIYRMRVRTSYRNGMSFNSCMTVNDGETEDYSIKIKELEGNCTGVPTAGTIEDDFGVCLNDPFSLSVSDASRPVNGLERIWQQSPNGEDWTDMEGANSSTYVVMEGIDETTYFRYKTSCNNSGGIDISGILEVSINPATDCYCIPKSSCDIYQAITNVTLEGESITLNNDSGCVEHGYNDYTDLPAPDLYPGGFYSLTVSTDYHFPELQEVKVWIDYNGNGVFDADEEIANTQGGGLPPNSSLTIGFVVPSDLEAGTYRMRTRLVYHDNNFNPCSYEANGETEDYNLEILPLQDCEEANAGTPLESSMNVCPGYEFQVSVLDSSNPGLGLETIWQSSLADEEDWTDIEGATTHTLIIEDGIETAMDYRYKVTCTNNGETDFSETIQVAIHGPTRCYCIPNFPFDVVPITLVDLKDGDGNVLIYNESPNLEDDPPSWEDFTDITADLEQGETYDMAIKANTGFNHLTFITVYIDWNQDGVYSTDEDDGEVYYLPDLRNSNGRDNRQSIGEIEVPESALPGYTQMRVTAKHLFVADPCNTDGSGQAEDYSVMVSGTLSTGSPDFENFSYYPNPVDDQLILKADKLIENVEIYNMLGQRILGVQPNTVDAHLNMDGLPTGAYMMNVTLDGVQKSFSIIKK